MLQAHTAAYVTIKGMQGGDKAAIGLVHHCIEFETAGQGLLYAPSKWVVRRLWACVAAIDAMACTAAAWLRTRPPASKLCMLNQAALCMPYTEWLCTPGGADCCTSLQLSRQAVWCSGSHGPLMCPRHIFRIPALYTCLRACLPARYACEWMTYWWDRDVVHTWLTTGRFEWQVPLLGTTIR